MKRGRLHVRDDEVPDVDVGDLNPSSGWYAAIRDTCSFCGQPFSRYDHGPRGSRCPNRPEDS